MATPQSAMVSLGGLSGIFHNQSHGWKAYLDGYAYLYNVQHAAFHHMGNMSAMTVVVLSRKFVEIVHHLVRQVVLHLSIHCGGLSKLNLQLLKLCCTYHLLLVTPLSRNAIERAINAVQWSANAAQQCYTTAMQPLQGKYNHAQCSWNNHAALGNDATTLCTCHPTVACKCYAVLHSAHMIWSMVCNSKQRSHSGHAALRTGNATGCNGQRYAAVMQCCEPVTSIHRWKLVGKILGTGQPSGMCWEWVAVLFHGSTPPPVWSRVVC